MKKIITLFLGIALLGAAIVIHASPTRRGLIPGATFTVKPVFDGTAELVNCVSAVPTTVSLFLDGNLSATQTTTVNDTQASFTVNENADGSFPVIAVTVQ